MPPRDAEPDQSETEELQTRSRAIFVETKRWRRRPREEYYGIWSAADGSIAQVSAKIARLLVDGVPAALVLDEGDARRRARGNLVFAGGSLGLFGTRSFGGRQSGLHLRLFDRPSRELLLG